MKDFIMKHFKKQKKDGINLSVSVDIRKIENFFKRLFKKWFKGGKKR